MEVPEKYRWIVEDLDVVMMTAEQCVAVHRVFDTFPTSKQWKRFMGQRGRITAPNFDSVANSPYPGGRMWYSNVYFPGIDKWGVYNDLLLPASFSMQDLADWIRKERSV